MLDNPLNKQALVHELFRLEASTFTGTDQEGEIDVRGDVLLTNGFQNTAADAVPGIGAQGAAGTMRLKEIILQEAVIDGEQPAGSECVGCA